MSTLVMVVGALLATLAYIGPQFVRDMKKGS